MALLPKQTILGKLSLLQIIESFDGPRLFACVNLSGQRFLAVWVDEDASGDTWLYVPVSEERLDLVLNGEFDLSIAFAQPEDRFVYIVLSPLDADGASTVEAVASKDIPAAWLPALATKLQAVLREPEGEYDHRELSEAVRLAERTRREVLDLRLKFVGGGTGEAPAGSLGRVLSGLQSVVDALGQSVRNEATPRGPIPEYVVQSTKMSVVATYPGSFGVRLASTTYQDMFGDSPLRPTLSRLTQLLESTTDQGALRADLIDLKIRVASRYRELLASLEEARSGLEVRWCSAGNSPVRRQLTDGQAAVAARWISEFEPQIPEEYLVIGVLIGGNVRTKRFEIENEADGKRYSGRVADTAVEDVSSATLTARYVATIRETKELGSATEEPRVKYELVALKRAQLVETSVPST